MFICTGITPSVAIDTVKKPTLPISNGKTLYVGGTGPNNYTKIQDAIDNADWGDTVFVYNGTYYETLEVHSITSLIGENKYTTIIDGNYSWYPIIDILTEPLKISGFTIQKSHFYGIECEYYHNNLTIDDNIIRENNKSGIDFYLYKRDCINNILSNNIISNNGDGVKIELSTDPYYSYNINIDITICSNTFTNNSNGIELEGSSGFTKTNNITIYNNIITNNNNGIYFYYAENNVINDNNITNNKVGIILGWASENNIIRNNTITKNNEGILLYMTDQNNIIDNNIINNLFGLNSCNSIRNHISKNNFIGNLRNAYFSIIWIFIPDTLISRNSWDLNYWDSWNGNGPKIIFGGLSRWGIILESILIDFIFYNKFELKLDILYEIFFGFRYMTPPDTWGRKFVKIPIVQFDWHPAKEPYDVEV